MNVQTTLLHHNSLHCANPVLKYYAIIEISLVASCFYHSSIRDTNAIITVVPNISIDRCLYHTLFGWNVTYFPLQKGTQSTQDEIQIIGGIKFSAKQ